MTDQIINTSVKPVQVENPNGSSSIVLVCEHASNNMPASFHNLGLPNDALESHIAWDPGAMGVAGRLSKRLNAVLVSGTVSRLIYDCNRPPSAPDAMPARSESVTIPGNVDLSVSERAERVATYYDPFRDELAGRIARVDDPVIVTIHSFTRTYNGEVRSVDIGVLHDSDTRLADAMLDCAPDYTDARVQRNQPYGPEHGVTHTLIEHAIPTGRLNVMLEIRNDLIGTLSEQRKMADMIAKWLEHAFAHTGAAGSVKCMA